MDRLTQILSRTDWLLSHLQSLLSVHETHYRPTLLLFSGQDDKAVDSVTSYRDPPRQQTVPGSISVEEEILDSREQ